MPNWCYGYVVVKGKPENIEAFCRNFIFEGEEGIKAKPNVNLGGNRYFARSFIHETWASFKKEYLGKRIAKFGVDFAWSVTSCLIEGYPQKDKQCFTLIDACKKYNVDVTIESEESGMGFEESIKCSRKGILKEEAFEMPIYRCGKCGESQQISSKSDLEDETCYECENIGSWKKVNKK